MASVACFTRTNVFFHPWKTMNMPGCFAQKLLYYLNDILDRKEKIQPKAIPFEQVPVTQIIKLLPGTNCRECGFKTCLAFAAMLSKAKVKPGKCPHMGATYFKAGDLSCSGLRRDKCFPM